MSLIHFLASSAGRLTHVVAGLILIGLGLFVASGLAGIVLIVVGMVPLIAGLADFCVFAPLFGAPLSGSAIHARH